MEAWQVKRRGRKGGEKRKKGQGKGGGGGGEGKERCQEWRDSRHGAVKYWMSPPLLLFLHLVLLGGGFHIFVSLRELLLQRSFPCLERGKKGNA